MVDFNNETTVTTPAHDVVKILILQRRNDVIEAIEHYIKNCEIGVSDDPSVVRSRIFSLFLELQGIILKRVDEKKVSRFMKEYISMGFSELLESFYDINILLYDINLTKVDNKIDYDTTDIELENQVNGL